MTERCWMCKGLFSEADLRHAAGIGWSCRDVDACRARKRKVADDANTELTRLRAVAEAARRLRDAQFHHPEDGGSVIVYRGHYNALTRALDALDEGKEKR